MARMMSLPVALTPDEVRERGEKLAAVVEEWKAAEDLKKSTAKHQKEAIDELKDLVLELKTIVRSKKENRHIEVADRVILERRVVETIRMDTEEVCGSRPMTPTELEAAAQGRLFVEDGDVTESA